VSVIGSTYVRLERFECDEISNYRADHSVSGIGSTYVMLERVEVVFSD
jgi:hypothetical protein